MKTQDVNAGLLAKLGGKFITDPVNIWVKVVYEKYLTKEEDISIISSWLKKVCIGPLVMVKR